jgi:hypothetical protein
MLEQGFPYDEAVKETAKQVSLIPKGLLNGTIVTSVGSGVICSGILQGLIDHKDNTTTSITGITVAPKNVKDMHRKIKGRTTLLTFGKKIPLRLFDVGYQYTQTVEMDIPFNCNKYYDRKAWEWLATHKEELKHPIIFWNIGGEG